MTLFYFFFFSLVIFSQNKIQKIEPPNWWTGMNNPHLQLLIYGNNIGDFNPEINYPEVSIKKIIKVENPNYLFIDLLIGKNAKPGTIKIDFLKENKIIESHNWELWQREKSGEEFIGFNNSDVMYLITPDRFANGDANNDGIAGLKEQPNRTFKGGRHGGDIEGIRKNLDYIKDMGFTAVWLNPVLENDMPEYSYHGYSTTDFYQVDARFGSNDSYRQLAKEASGKGIKLIMDMIVNHCGLDHWWMEDQPMSDWINNWEVPTFTNHRKSVLQDPYVSELDRKVFTDGWFVSSMPDLNQRNVLMANYLTQNSIWWVEYLGLAGIRMDTYPYPDMDYMTEWTEKVMAEYPNLNIVGEEWYGDPAIVSYWQRGKENANGYTSALPSLMDFPLQTAVVKALNEPEGFGSGWITLYEMLAKDFLYADPFNLVVFPDNHDMSRIFTQINEDFDLFKLAIAYTLTTRGTPQIYYGTEILMKNPGTGDHGIIRSDFPGGWAGDADNGFTGEGLTDQQKAAKSYTKALLNWRKNAPAVHNGKLIHFLPMDGVYVYFRFNAEQKIMVILNKNENNYSLDLNRFKEIIKSNKTGINILNGEKYDLNNKINLPIRAPLIVELN